jgi:hypothetical protein
MKFPSMLLPVLFPLIGLAQAQDPFYPSPPNLDTSRLFLPENLEYKGAFKLSRSTAGTQYGLTYLVGGMTWHPGGDPGGPQDGYPGSIFIAGHASERKVAEIALPAPSLSRNYDSLPTAAIITPFQELAALQSNSGIRVMDLAWLEAQPGQTEGKIHVTLGDGYLPTPPQRTYNNANADFSGRTEQRIFVPDRVHCYNDYLFTVPEAWAARWAPGMRLAGGRHREGDLCGEGPALYLMAPWTDPQSDSVQTWPILRYKQDGGSLVSYSRGGDVFYAGTWLEGGDKSAVVFAGRKGLGQPDYGTHCGVQGFHDLAGYRAYMIFYDPEDLGKVHAGLIQPYEPQPYAAMDVSDRLIFPITDSCRRYHLDAFAFDPVNGVLYATERSRGEFPVMHVWTLTGAGGTGGGGGGTDTTGTGGGGTDTTGTGGGGTDTTGTDGGSDTTGTGDGRPGKGKGRGNNPRLLDATPSMPDFLMRSVPRPEGWD